jgi:Transmembrane protein
VAPQIGLHTSSLLLHAIGVLTVLLMILDGWSVEAYKYIFALCVALPAAVDAYYLTLDTLVKGKILEYLEIRI